MLFFVIVRKGDFMTYLEPFSYNPEEMKILFKNNKVIIYTDGIYCYKVFNEYDKDKYIKERLEILMDYRIFFNEHFIIPEELYREGKTFAYKTLYIPNTFNLANYFSSSILFIAQKIDSLLRKLHRKGIVFGDFHFDNILIDKNESPYLIDFDNIQISFYKGLFLTQSFLNLATFYHLTIKKDYEINENTDKICFYLSLLELYFGIDFLKITLKEINKEEKRNYIIFRIYYIVLDCFTKKNFDYVPYFCELFQEPDCSLLLR